MVLLDFSVYLQYMPAICAFRTFAVTGVLLNDLEDDNQLPVLRVLGLVVKVCRWEAAFCGPASFLRGVQ